MGFLLCLGEITNGQAIHSLFVLLLIVKTEIASSHGSETPSLRVNKHINHFVHSTLSILPFLSSNLYYFPSLFLFASPSVSLFATTFIISMCYLWKANCHMVHFHFPFFQNTKQNENNNSNFITILQNN